MSANDMEAQIALMLGDLLGDMEKRRLECEEKAAQADPEKHKLSRVLKRGCDTSYCYYYGGKTKRRVVWWCYANHPNVAGYYLSWKETRTKKLVKRTMYKAWKKQTSAQAWCMKHHGKL